MSLSERERITLLMMRGWGENVRSYDAVRNLFNDSFPERNPISKSTVVKTVTRFQETGSVKDCVRTGRPTTVTGELASLDVLQHFVENPTESLRTVALQLEISHESVRKVLKKSGFKAYRVHLVQELNEDDYDRRLEFCEGMMERIDRNQILLNEILFSDEATFMLNGTVNRHNCRYWDNSNPNLTIETHTQHPQKLNVWAGIIGNQVIGPFFINGNLSAALYLQMLQNEIIPALEASLGPQLFQRMYFQQDGAPPHFGVDVRQYLDAIFPQRWIGRRGAVEWPARSPDLSPLDFFFWGYLKEKVYRTKPQDLAQLQQKISQEAQDIPRDYLQNAVGGFYNRLGHCQTAGGGHFEHLL